MLSPSFMDFLERLVREMFLPGTERQRCFDSQAPRFNVG
jgi:hypothetical protein